MRRVIRDITALFGIAPARWFILIALAVTAGAVEILAALMIFLLVSAITEPDLSSDLPVLGDVRERFPGLSDASFLLWMATVVGIFFIARAVLLIGQAYVQNRISHGAGVRLSSRLLRGYLQMPYEFHLRRNSSEMIRNAYTSVTQIVTFGFAPLVMLASEILLVLGIVMALVLTAPAGTFLVFLFVAPVFFLLYRAMQKGMDRLGSVNQEMSNVSLRSLQESLQNVRDIRVLGREAYFASRFEVARARLARVLYLRGMLIEVPRVTTETLLVMSIVLFLVVALTTGTKDLDQTLAVLGLFGYAGIRLLPSLSRIVGNLNNLRFARAAVNDVSEELRTFHEQIESSAPPGELVLALDERILADRLSFRFDGADRDALGDVTFEIRKGESIGVVGPTGAGKSTLIDVLMGLLSPSAGSVTVDGSDVHTHARGWQRNLGVVPQTTFLLDDTLRRNIALGVADADIDEEALDEALRTAHVDEFIATLPEGLDTIVGERGIRLSGGQRQRVAIARALYRRPQVLVLDEATAALDSATEAALMASLFEMQEDRTVIMIAHRLSTVRRCDRILVLVAGRLADVGSYEDLHARSALFRELAR